MPLVVTESNKEKKFGAFLIDSILIANDLYIDLTGSVMK